MVPVHVTIDADRYLIRVKYVEPYTFDEWLGGVATFRNHRVAPFDKRFGLLIDRTGVGDLPTSFASQIVKRVSASAHLVKQRRIAIVVRLEGVGPATLQGMMYEEAGAFVGVFTSIAEAEHWLERR